MTEAAKTGVAVWKWVGYVTMTISSVSGIFDPNILRMAQLNSFAVFCIAVAILVKLENKP